MDVEIFNFYSLKKAWKESRSKKELREHVTTHIRENNSFSKINVKYKKDYSFLRLTLDEAEDEKVLIRLLDKFSNIFNIEINDIIKLYKKNEKIFQFNKHIKRNEGGKLNTGQKVWKRAQKIIPGGTMLFSKNPDLFLPKKWPAYFSKSKGYKVWDLDGNSFADLSFMGVGTNTLGYSNSKIEKKVLQTIKNGNMTTLNSLEEIKLAEKLIELHPWADMARFTRSGGEANAVAIRIARAVCGYHGWHDWYLASNIINKSSLDEHLMRKVPIKGVPKNLKNTVFPFSYNNFEELESIVEKNDIGVIKMEVKRNDEPKNNFLHKVKKLSEKKNIVLIFDECTSGFRQVYGGLHKLYKVNPDIAIFGKALGNGYAINAIIGKKSVMETARSTFISSTFWTERIGPTAALETLKIMEDIKSWKIISNIGIKIIRNWENISNTNKVKIDIKGINAIPNFSFRSKNNLLYKTLITQEMLKNKIFASNAVYCCVMHDDKILKKYFDIMNEVFLKIKNVESGRFSINDFLNSEVCLSGLRTKDN
jgi:glutamate-1-semialdehyde aminotransferase